MFQAVPSLLHIISHLFLTFPMLLAVESSAFAPALALITVSESIQLLGRKQPSFIWSGYVFCHINELRQLKKRKRSNKPQTHCTTCRKCTAGISTAVVKSSSFRIHVLLDQLNLWNSAFAGYYQVIQSCSLWGQKECNYWFLRKAVAKECSAFGPVLYLCSAKDLLPNHRVI